MSGGLTRGTDRWMDRETHLQPHELGAEQLAGPAPLLQGAGELGGPLLQGTPLLRVHRAQQAARLALQLLDLEVLGGGGRGAVGQGEGWRGHT